MKSSWVAAPLLASAFVVLALVPASHAWASVTVSHEWQSIPRGLCPADEFRLLFGTHERTQLLNNHGFEILDNFVTNSASRSDHIREYADEFKALVSCGRVGAMTHTSTTHSADDPGVPIYWVRGDKVADDYRDFYDGSWDSNEARDQYGRYEYLSDEFGIWVTVRGVLDSVWTGTNYDGTSPRNHACSSNVMVGGPYVHGKEIQRYVQPTDYRMSMYGISPVFKVPDFSSIPTITVSATHNTASLRLDAPAVHGDTTISDYVVEVRLANSDWTQRTQYHYEPGTTHTITGLRPGVEYSVQVYAKSNWSGGSATWLCPGIPATTFRTHGIHPTAPAAPSVSATDTTATVRWSAPEWPGATPIFDYDVAYRTINPNGPWTAAGPPYHHGTGTTHTITGLAPETTYQVRVHAVNHGLGSLAPHYGPWSQATTFHTLEAGCGGSGDTRPAAATVSAGWLFTPDGMCPGDKFRLLFVTSGNRDGSGGDLLYKYYRFVSGQIRAGHDEIAPHSNIFRVLMSDQRTDAINATQTTYNSHTPGVPIYWLGGDKVADDYRDFWDGCWDSNEARDQRGNVVPQGRQVWTGTDSDGRESDFPMDRQVRSTIGTPSEACSEINSGELRTGNNAGVYGLSLVFEVE